MFRARRSTPDTRAPVTAQRRRPHPCARCAARDWAGVKPGTALVKPGFTHPQLFCVCFRYTYNTMSFRAFSAMARLARVAVTGGTHGNEPNGVELARHLQRHPELAARGSFDTTVLITNPAAVAKSVRYLSLIHI